MNRYFTRLGYSAYHPSDTTIIVYYILYYVLLTKGSLEVLTSDYTESCR